MPHKYARVERERRFLIERMPDGEIVQVRRIQDRYISHTRLRLREQVDREGERIFKLTQKIPTPGAGAQQGLITTIYLSEPEFRLLSGLPGKSLYKSRYSIPPFGIDVFEGPLQGLRLAEVEFQDAAQADAFTAPDFLTHEVTGDVRFTGGELVRASRDNLHAWLAEYGLSLAD